MSRGPFETSENTMDPRFASKVFTASTSDAHNSDSIRSPPCADLSHDKGDFRDHLRDVHSIQDRETIKKKIKGQQVGSSGQGTFWCGFCERILRLKTKGMDAWDERFNHVDNRHFKIGRDIFEWRELHGVLKGGSEWELKAQEGKIREWDLVSKGKPTAVLEEDLHTANDEDDFSGTEDGSEFYYTGDRSHVYKDRIQDTDAVMGATSNSIETDQDWSHGQDDTPKSASFVVENGKPGRETGVLDSFQIALSPTPISFYLPDESTTGIDMHENVSEAHQEKEVLEIEADSREEIPSDHYCRPLQHSSSSSSSSSPNSSSSSPSSSGASLGGSSTTSSADSSPGATASGDLSGSFEDLAFGTDNVHLESQQTLDNVSNADNQGRCQSNDRSMWDNGSQSWASDNSNRHRGLKELQDHTEGLPNQDNILVRTQHGKGLGIRSEGKSHASDEAVRRNRTGNVQSLAQAGKRHATKYMDTERPENSNTNPRPHREWQCVCPLSISSLCLLPIRRLEYTNERTVRLPDSL